MRSNEEIISTLEMRKGIKKYLDYEDFKEFVKGLSCSQGFYSRLYMQLLELEQEGNEECLEELKRTIEEQHFTDTLDFVFWLEC